MTATKAIPATAGGASTATTGRRKRPLTETSPDGDVDRRRGRPRVDKQDESAADRRRTQIRMAQRAYRQRKESTLEELRKRVSELTNTIELMNRSFLDFNARFQALGPSTAQTTELEDLSLRFEALVKDARHPSDDTLPAAANGTKTSSSNSTSHELEAADLVPAVKNVPSWLDQSAISSEANRPGPSPTDLGMGYTIYDAGDGPALDLSMLSKDLVPGLHIQDLTRAPPTTAPSPDKITFSAPFFDDDYDPFPLPTQPSPPRTFSFQESTFARRLHRACLERAYQLLLDPDMRPATYERVFRLSLLGRSRAKILNVIKTVLARGPHQDLDFWDAPLIHVGGAGTHYPPRDAFGNRLPKRTARDIGKIGPQTLALLDNASRDQVSLHMAVEIAGYEGEWFDADDVQGYLEEKGVFIDPSATFVEAVLEVGDEEAEAASGVSAVRARGEMGTGRGVQDASGLDADATGWDDLFAGTELTGVGFSDALTGSWMNFLQPGEAIRRTTAATTASTSGDITSTAQVPPRWTEDWMTAMDEGQDLSLVPLTPHSSRTKKVVIDVRKLIKALGTSGVCLGRTPGFRRKDVDLALKLAAVETF